MNLLLRLLWTLFASPRRAAVPALGPCRTPFRVWPTDLDVLRHVNNGVYLSIMDLARVDLMTRAGFAAKLRAKGWFPVVVAETIQFRRSLTLWQRFDIETRVLGWDDKAIVVQQQFIRGEEVLAHALVRARFLSKAGGAVAPRELMQFIGIDAQSPPLGDYATRWNADQVEWKGTKP
jgi:YbgC/YbaW family acyl-CoA thioester hydrolase